MVAVDGCGAPLLSASLTGLARGFRELAVADSGPERRVADAIREHPAYVSGSTRDERALLTAIPGAIGKAGAEACYAVALRDGRAFALKADDGYPRVRPVLMAAALRRSRRRHRGRRGRRGGARHRAVALLGGGVPGRRDPSDLLSLLATCEGNSPCFPGFVTRITPPRVCIC